MKNLANCTPTEFFKQTVKIKKTVEAWIKDVGLMEIRSTKPTLRVIPTGISDNERIELLAENRRIIKEHSAKMMSTLFDNAFEKNADKTMEIIALLCFVEPKDVDTYTVSEYLGSFTEMMNDKSVADFFSLLLQWGQINTSTVAEK